jgi:type IV pilus assembly protein PilY1
MRAFCQGERKMLWKKCLTALSSLPLLFHIANTHAATYNLSDVPLYLNETVPPLMLLTMSKNHKLFYEAYNDASDLDGDGVLDLRYKPDSVDYYGYFDSHKCYNYTGSYFEPASTTTNKKCSGAWSGDFLNYLTMTRMDVLRKSMYGGYRSSDSNGLTILERAYVPQDAHSWGKEYRSVAVDGFNISEYTPLALPTGGGTIRHLFANTTLLNSAGQEPRLRVLANSPYRIWEWVSRERPVADNSVIPGGGGSVSVTPTDYIVRVKVCDSSLPEDNCAAYPNGNLKPTGLLHRYGENQSMKFGLLTGSYTKNLSGGVLRKNVGDITDEIDVNTGIFTSTVGIIKTMDRIRIPNFGGSYEHQSNCGFIFNRALNEGECRSWGNPVAEMMYEGLRYFAGKATPTASFDAHSGDDVNLGLPHPSWVDPYDPAENHKCAPANMMVLSDVEPNYDSDQVPGSSWSSFSGDLSLNASSIGDTIWQNEFGASRSILIGEASGTNDGAPTLKTASSFSNIRGLAPSEPTKQGSYYSASVAYHGVTNDLHTGVSSTQNVSTYVITFPSATATIPFNVNNNTILFSPFAKSVGGCGATGSFKPTDTIVDLYIESLSPTSGVVRINYEDVEQGADHDMDAITRYTFNVDSINNALDITTDSTYAAGCIIQHIGYTLAGTNNDGAYLVVRDRDTAAGSDVDYALDTPNVAGALPLSDTRSFTPSGAAVDNTLLESPLWYAAKWGGFTDLNQNNLPDLAQEWDEDADGNPDNYFLVINLSQLEAKIDALFQQVIARNSSASSSTVSTGSINTNTRVYQSIFNSGDWSGQLLSFAVNPSNGALITTGSGPNGSQWDAGNVISGQNWDTGREIITYDPIAGNAIAFRWNDLGTAQQTALDLNPVSSSADGLGASRLEYIRGNQSLEVSGGGSFRDRSVVLGDIVNSAPIYVDSPSFPYSGFIWPSGAPENGSATYADFKTTYENRQDVVYVGANDGMLHAINADNGEEMFAYIPSVLIDRLNLLTSQNYSHKYYADGSITPGDVFFNSNNSWRSVIVGGLNKGGQAVFALDVTNPSLFNENNASSLHLWEFTDADDADLGYSFSQPSIVRMSNGKWAAVFGNGYNSTELDSNTSSTGNAVLYVVDIETGSLVKKFDTGVGALQDPAALGRPNGLSSPAVADVDGDFVADYIYAGDLFGNIWKFDVNDTNPTNWAIAFSGNPLYSAQDSLGTYQPITARVALAARQGTPDHIQLFVGTGKYLEASDKNTNSIQTFYSLVDSHTTPIASRTDLLQQQVLDEQFIGTTQLRVTSNNTMSSSQRGWFMDFNYGSNNLGERVVSHAIYRDKKIVFTTLIPSSDVCVFGGSSWLMELNAHDGARLSQTPFDINGDGQFNGSDLVSYGGGGQKVAIGGIQPSSVLMQTPSILSNGEADYKYSTTSNGTIEVSTENPTSGKWGRESWQQLK